MGRQGKHDAHHGGNAEICKPLLPPLFQLVGSPLPLLLVPALALLIIVTSTYDSALILPLTRDTTRREQISGIIKGEEAVSAHGNYRPLQPLGTRPIFKSGGPVSSTKACPSRGVTEAGFVCSVGSSASSLAASTMLSAVMAAFSLAVTY